MIKFMVGLHSGLATAAGINWYAVGGFERSFITNVLVAGMYAWAGLVLRAQRSRSDVSEGVNP